MLKTTTTAAALSALILSTALAQSAPSGPTTVRLAQSTSPGASENTDRNMMLTNAASISEDLIGVALDGKADNIAEQVGKMQKALPTLQPLLDVTALETLERYLIDMEQASSKNDTLATALVAVEANRIIESAINPDSPRAP
jgi:hypothetical protein